VEGAGSGYWIRKARKRVRVWIGDTRDGDFEVRVVISIAQLITVHVKRLCA
jgi:hypothetical protein